MRVLVTGGSGFLGSHVVERLLERGHEVACLVRRSSDTSFLEGVRGSSGARVALVTGAIDDAASLERAVADCEGVVHCAGVVKARSYDDYERVHKEGTLALARVAMARPGGVRRFVHVSTAGVMGAARADRAHLEGDAPSPVTPYSRSKLAGEQALLELAGELPVTVIRPPAIYGPRDREILAFFQMVRRSRAAFRMERPPLPGQEVPGLGLAREDRVVVVMCGSKKSMATGVPMASLLFPTAIAGSVVLPVLVFHQVQLLVAAARARRWGGVAG
jgi:nucleoside-diphosphate-sugar epimerase